MVFKIFIKLPRQFCETIPATQENLFDYIFCFITAFEAFIFDNLTKKKKKKKKVIVSTWYSGKTFFLFDTTGTKKKIRKKLFSFFHFTHFTENP